MTDPRREPVVGREAGVTLIELMIVLVIVAVGVLALSGVQTRSSTDVYSTGRNTRALQLAQLRMETTRSAGFTLAASDSGSANGFGWQTAVDSVDVGLRRVRVTVSWKDRGRARSLELDNFVAQR